MYLDVNTPALLGVAATIESISAELHAAHAAAAPAIMSVLPSGIDDVSILSAAAFNGFATQHDAMATPAAEEIGRAAVEAGNSARSYLTEDLTQATTYNF